MKLLIAILILTTLVFVRTEDESEDVLVLTQDNFDDIIKENDHVLVKFYAPWCGHCKALAPEYDKAAQKLKEEGSSVKLGKVDATVHTELAARFKVQGYPTLKFFRKGSEIEFNGPRKADGIIGWIKKKLGPPLTEVSSSTDFEKFKKDNKIVAAIFSKDESHDSHKAVSDAAGKLDDVTFLWIKDDSVAKDAGIDNPNTLVLFRQFDDPKVVYNGEWNADDIHKFVKVEMVSLVTEFSQETAQAVFESSIKTHIIGFSAKKSSDYETHMKLLKEVALAMKGKLHVVIIDMDDEETARVGEFFGTKASDVPTFRIIKLDDDMVKFQPEKTDFTVAYITEFAKGVLDGKIKPHLKSAEEPKDWNENPVKVLVANKFEERAVSSDKAVFVEFYAPWCGHCKALAPIWDELGEHYKDNEAVIIAKCDATENELENIKVSSFPTLKFSPKGSTDFIDYKGERTKEEFIKFIDSNGKSEPKKDDDGDKHDEL